MLRTYLALLLLLIPTLVQAQDNKANEEKPGDKMIAAYLAAETDKLSQKFMDGARTLEQWQQKRPRLYQEYMYMLGLWPLPEKTPLHATITGTLERGDVVIDRLHFQSKPGLYVTANLYRPRGNTKKLPTILYVCGHSNRGRDGNKTAFQDHGLWFASNGYNCLVVDTLQLGEIPGVHHGTYGVPYNHLAAYGIKDKNKPETRWWWHCRGYTPAGVECWNGIRAIDYLVSRPDVDADKIGVTGISGGGAATFWIAAADERVKVAVPVSGMSDLESYVKNKVINGHCDCMFLYNTYQWEWTTIAALIAPRPLLFANSDNDRIFPMDGNRRIIARLRELYKLYGKPKLVDDYVSEGGHAYRSDLRVAIFRFINKHLKNDTTTPVKDADFPTIPGEELRVFPTDADIPQDALNGKIDETFVPVARVELPAKGKFAEWKAGLMKQLREQVFRPFPEKFPPATVRENKLASVETEKGIYLYYLGASPGEKESQHATLFVFLTNMFGRAEDFQFRLREGRLERIPGPDTIPEKLNAEINKGLIAVIWPRGSNPNGEPEWSTKSPPNYVERSHVLLGRTVAEGQVLDVILTMKRLEVEYKDKKHWKIGGDGPAGILAAYAALFEPSIDEIVVVNPPKSHREGPYFLNVLRVLDIPEALGMLAPRRLTLVNVDDALYNRVAEIYRRAGAEDKLQRK